MKEEYDFSKSIKNPYAKKVKKQISIKIEKDTIESFSLLRTQNAIKESDVVVVVVGGVGVVGGVWVLVCGQTPHLIDKINLPETCQI